jgi:hypothetical protein
MSDQPQPTNEDTIEDRVKKYVDGLCNEGRITKNLLEAGEDVTPENINQTMANCEKDVQEDFGVGPAGRPKGFSR